MNKKSLLFLFVLVFVVAVSYSQSITVTNPHSGDTWYKGRTYTIRWTKAGSMDTQVKITLYKPDHTTLQTIIVRPTDNDGSFDWTIPNSIPAGQYIVRVKTMDNAVYDDGEEFTIANASAQTASITVTSPHSGDTWYKGNIYTIRWTKSGSMDSNVKIGLMQNGRKVLEITDSTVNNGNFDWAVDHNIADGNYQIRIKTVDNRIYSDSETFTITEYPEIFFIPPYPRCIEKGRTYTIRWASVGKSEYVKISLLRGMGTLVRIIADSTENDGSYKWTVPRSLSDGRYNLKIEMIDNIGVEIGGSFDIKSTCPFVVHPEDFINSEIVKKTKLVSSISGRIIEGNNGQYISLNVGRLKQLFSSPVNSSKTPNLKINNPQIKIFLYQGNTPVKEIGKIEPNGRISFYDRFVQGNKNVLNISISPTINIRGKSFRVVFKNGRTGKIINLVTVNIR